MPATAFRILLCILLLGLIINWLVWTVCWCDTALETKSQEIVFNAFTKILSSYKDAKKAEQINSTVDKTAAFVTATHSVAFTLVCCRHGKCMRTKGIFYLLCLLGPRCKDENWHLLWACKPTKSFLQARILTLFPASCQILRRADATAIVWIVLEGSCCRYHRFAVGISEVSYCPLKSVV